MQARSSLTGDKMKHAYLFFTAFFALSLLLAACGARRNSTSTPEATPMETSAGAATMEPTGTVEGTTTSDGTETPDAGVGTPEPNGSPSTLVTVTLGQNAQLGSFLVDGQGITLYLFTNDRPNTSTCYGQCAAKWLPLLTTTNGSADAGSGLEASKLATTTRSDGTIQVTYNNWPLYYYSQDRQPGDVKGQGVGGVWFVVSPVGDKIDK
jgi:predicted lipoprotein with Yx(FWY)xxD motif